MNDEFEPKRYITLDESLRSLEENERKRIALEQELYNCRVRGRIPLHKRAEAAKLQKRLEALENDKASLETAVAPQIKELEQGRRPFVLQDEIEQEYNECVGYAFGLAICVDSGNNILCCEQQPDVTEIGDTLFADELIPLSYLPDGEQDMILRELLKDADTPVWFKNRITAA